MLCGVFQLADGGKFMLAYHRIGDARPTVERFDSFDAAQARANHVLNATMLIPK